MRRLALPEQQAGGNEDGRALDPSSASGLRATAASKAWENSRPIVAPICATSFAGPSSVEPRHQRRVQACRHGLQGPAREPPQACAGPRPRSAASSTAFVISSTNKANAVGALDDLRQHVRRQLLVTNQPRDDRGRFAALC